MTTRRPKRPLVKAAVDKANQTVWDNHEEELKGRQLNWKGSDYPYRREWMDAYLKALETDEEVPPGEPIEETKTPCPPLGGYAKAAENALEGHKRSVETLSKNAEWWRRLEERIRDRLKAGATGAGGELVRAERMRSESEYRLERLKKNLKALEEAIATRGAEGVKEWMRERDIERADKFRYARESLKALKQMRENAQNELKTATGEEKRFWEEVLEGSQKEHDLLVDDLVGPEMALRLEDSPEQTDDCKQEMREMGLSEEEIDHWVGLAEKRRGE